MAFDISQLLQPGKVALLLSEVQRNVIGDLTDAPLAQVAKQVGVTPAAARLAKIARAHGAPVIHCLAKTGPGRFGTNSNARLFKGAGRRAPDAPPHDPAHDAPCPEVYEDGDILSPREHGLNPMADTTLDHRMRNEGIRTIIAAGVSLNVAIVNMTMDAVNAGYQVIIARDAVSGYPIEYHEHVLNNTLSLLATLATVDEIAEAWNRA